MTGRPTPDSRDGPGPEAVRKALQTLADAPAIGEGIPLSELTSGQRTAVLQTLGEALEDQYPGIIAVPLTPGETPPRGARVLPAVLEADGEPPGDVRVPRPRRGRRHDDSVDQ